MKNIIKISSLFLIFVFSMSASAQTAHPFPPAPIYSQMLLHVGVDAEGMFRQQSMYAYFLSGEKGTMRVLHNGSEIATYSFRISPYKPPKYELDGFELVTGKNDVLGLKLTNGGHYELHYYDGEKLFYKFPFELVVKKNNDPYNPKSLLLINGAWNDRAYLYRTSTEAHGKWEFKVWMRSDDGSLQQTKSYVRLVRDSDQKIVAVGQTNFRREQRWIRHTLTLEKPGKQNPKGEYYDNQDLLASRDKFTDGAYTLNFYMDENLYGAYKFTVSGGEIQMQGDQKRETTDPLKFIEGGGNEIWLKRQ